MSSDDFDALLDAALTEALERATQPARCPRCGVVILPSSTAPGFCSPRCQELTWIARRVAREASKPRP
jgi:endogenous inhibitor of DNA gyrase (YacG/DUF329 family)